MKNNKHIGLWIFLALFSLTLNAYFLLFNSATSATTDNSEIQKPQSDIYTCPMHPQVVQDHPGDCPICGMKLVKKMAGSTSDVAMDSMIGTVNLSPTQELLANIAVERPRPAHFENALTVTGAIRAIDGSSWKAASRMMGRIEKFHVSNAGESLREGDPIYDLFSPDIASAAQEFLYVLEHPGDDSLGTRAEAIRAKLLSSGLEFGHLIEIARLKQAFDVYTFHAPRSGVVMSKMASEGEWIMPGMTVIDFLDLSSVYVEGALLERDAASVKIGSQIRVASVSGESGNGTVTLIGPMADMMTRTIPFRATLPNPGLKWTPGSFVTVEVAGTEGFDALSLPEDAVLTTGRGSVVWIRTAEGRFVSRPVIAGLRQAGRIAVLQGLNPDDEVAITGAYLIDSDAQIGSMASHAMPTPEAAPQTSANQTANSKFPFICPMHPEVVAAEPGRCPECGMYLVEKESLK